MSGHGCASGLRSWKSDCPDGSHCPVVVECQVRATSPSDTRALPTAIVSES